MRAVATDDASVAATNAGAAAVDVQYTAALPARDVTLNATAGVPVFQGAPVSGEPGQPLLPAYTLTFLLPSDADFSAVKVRLDDPAEQELDGTFDVPPALPPTARGEAHWPAGRRIANGKDMDVYGQSAFFPGAHKGNVHFGAMREYKMVEVTVHPYRYNPASRKLRMLTGGTVVVTVPGSRGSTAPTTLRAAPESAVETWLRSNVVNSEALPDYGVQTQPATLQGAPAAVASGTYAIITTTAIRNGSSQLANLVALKQQKGFTVITATESTWGGGTGDPAANNIRAWLKTNYGPQNIRYVLLIGNPHPSTGDVPMKECWPLPDITGADPDAPTDYFYAELSGNWDINNDGRYGDWADYNMVGGPDQYAEIAVGRLPYYGNMATLDKIIQKIIRYENETAVEWRRSVMLPMKPTDVMTPSFEIGERIRTDVLVPSSVSSYRLYDAVNSYTGVVADAVLGLAPPAEAPECSEARVLSAWKNGAFGLVTWFTHGSAQGAAGVLTSADTTYLDDQHPSIVYQSSCYNSQPEDSANLAYSLLANGAVATIASPRTSWYLPGLTEFAGSASNQGMVYTFVQNLVRDGMEIAPALNQVKSNTSLAGTSCWWANYLDYGVYGCPDEALRLKPSVAAAPSRLAAAAASSSQINLSWSDNSSSETGFTVERARYNGAFSQIATVGANVTSYQDSGLAAGTEYLYRVRAYTSADSSLPSSVASTWTVGPAVAPTGVAIQAASGGQLLLTWNAVAGATSYNTWFSDKDGGPYSILDPDLVSTGDYCNLTPGKTFYFVVTAVTANGESPYSAQVSAAGALRNPISLTATALSTAEVQLDWIYNARGTLAEEVTIDIEYATTGAFTLLSSVTAVLGSNTFTASGLAPGTTYQFRLRAREGTVYSPYSDTASATTQGQAAPLYRIDCGSTSGTSPFTADQYGSGGTRRTVTNAIDLGGVPNAAPQAVYQSERYGASTYTLPNLTPGGPYTVRLHFAELYQTASGRRLFNVAINGTTVLSRFDIYAQVGARYKATVREFTATANASGQIVVQFSNVTDNATIEGIEVIAANGDLAPTVATPATASPNPVTGTTAALSVLGADDGGEGSLTYNWSTVGAPPAAVSFSANGTNGAKNCTATFTKAGSYTLQATMTDGGGLTATSSVTMTVNQTLTSIVVSPSSPTVNVSATQQFSATARDQFAASLTAQPTFTWSVSGGGTISPSGLFTAASSAGGPYTVTAASGAVRGQASVTVTSNGTPVYRTDCGSSSGSSPFTADQYGSGGTVRTVTNTINLTGVTNPAPQAVYQSERFGASTYTFPNLTAGAQYTVRLHFAELYHTVAGARVFNVAINGTTVLPNFDIYAQVGARYKATVRQFTATANGSGQIVIAFTTVKNNATIEGIEIIH